MFMSEAEDISETEKPRSAAVEDILKKINKISSESMSNADNNDKENMLRSIEIKLRKAAQPLGKKGDKYVNLIMRGLRSGTTSKGPVSLNNLNTTPPVISNVAQNKNDLRISRNAMIDFIMQKINRISQESLNNVTSKDEKEKILKSIENKLRNVSRPLGEKGSKFINLIMKGIRTKNSENLKDEDSKSEDKRRSAHVQKQDSPDNSRNAMTEFILKKIYQISMESQNTNDQQNRLSLVEDNLRKAAEPLGEKGLKYVNLIMRAIHSTNKNISSQNDNSLSAEINEVVDDAFKLNYNVIKMNEGNERLKKQAIENIARAIEKVMKKYSANQYDEIIENIKLKTFDYMKRNDILKNNNDIKLISDLIVDSINLAGKRIMKQKGANENATNYPVIDVDADFLAPYNNEISSQTKLLCKSAVERTCANIRNMNMLKCAYMEERIPLHKLCDGKYDCSDRSDEKHCAQQATERVHYAHSVLIALDISLENDCLMTDINEKILSKQNLILRDVLRAQLNFIDKYKLESAAVTDTDSKLSNNMIRSSIKEITDVIGTLTKALDKALCSRNEIKNDHNLRRYNEIFDEDVDLPQKIKEKWAPEACSCKEKSCSNCTNYCQRICWHKNSLTHWNCDSVNETSMVSLNVLCDGKYDCYDESDEKDCFSDNVHGKFEAHKIFSEITDSLKLKASKDYKTEKNKVLSLVNTLSSLEKLSLNSNPNPTSIKEYRDQSFELLDAIYSGVIKHTTYAYEAEDVYIFLLSVNQQLGAILKRIGTGNKKIMSDSCFCRNGKCAATFCTRRCQKACVIEPKLTRYFCENNNKSIDIENICDGKIDCPQEDDERQCSKEICRSHHITVLQHKVQEVGLKQKGTAMGELLSTWKTKVLATLKVAEKSGRPTRRTLKDLVKEILQDLVLTYGSVEEYRRRNNNYAVQEFTDIAETILDTLRSCDK
ncbi:unnamed protein product [Colias eurytheme]|nr:unnamed protein product [Colias eurytheme]